MSRTYDVVLTLERTVRVTIADDCDAITRVTGPEGNDWRRTFYDLYTEEDVFEMIAANAVFNGCTDARQLDGWADLPEGAVVMRVADSEPTVEGADVYPREKGAL